MRVVSSEYQIAYGEAVSKINNGGPYVTLGHSCGLMANWLPWYKISDYRSETLKLPWKRKSAINCGCSDIIC
ncbi:hypothetical protein CEXT_206641 [Caerostris extrusa]|uniref:Uncharacterized protein n=1 Tax=Caerostris extrusa TaxID=172846 RepID=A0AAV4MVH7_CAEEX|nr:hypothetical protein CEXT_206641 [Caerostris extrusa]